MSDTTTGLINGGNILGWSYITKETDSPAHHGVNIAAVSHDNNLLLLIKVVWVVVKEEDDYFHPWNLKKKKKKKNRMKNKIN